MSPLAPHREVRATPPAARGRPAPWRAAWLLVLVAWLSVACSHAPAPRSRPTAAPPSRPAATAPRPAAPTARSAERPTPAERPAPSRAAVPAPAPVRAAAADERALAPVRLGIDVLAERGFAELRGQRVGLLTHPAGVNRRGESTIDVLRRAPGVRLVALYGVEHGVRGQFPASHNYADGLDAETGLRVFSLHSGRSRKPTPEQLRGIDVLVIDLQDIGTRSYTYVSAMKLALEACFENGKAVVVLDRPNPLGGLKVDGPGLDARWATNNYVGAFRVPYVHGLTIGELARLAKNTPGVLAISESARSRGRLTVVPMQGWRRSMRWPETGLRWIPTSPLVADYATVQGYPMTGLGCEIGGFVHGIGKNHLFRTLSFRGRSPEELKAALDALRLPGLAFSVVAAAGLDGGPRRAVLVHVTNWDLCRPTELNFHLQRLAASWSSYNAFAAVTDSRAESFNKHCGSAAWWTALVRDGARVDVARFTAEWRRGAAEFQAQSRRWWLYQP